MSERRCPICDWALAADRADGCVPGDCSYRPEVSTPEWNRIERNRQRVITDTVREAFVREAALWHEMGDSRPLYPGSELTVGDVRAAATRPKEAKHE